MSRMPLSPANNIALVRMMLFRTGSSSLHCGHAQQAALLDAALVSEVRVMAQI